MAEDAVVSRELQSLQEELSVAQRQRLTPAAGAPAMPTTATAPDSKPAATDDVGITAEEHNLRDQLGELVKEMGQFFEQVDKRISANPTESVIGALCLGIVIGSLLARR